MDLVSAGLDGVLSPEEEQKLAEHLSDCAQCQAVQQDFTEMRDRLRKLPEHSLSELDQRRLQNELARNLQPRRRRWPMRHLAAAAAVALLMGGLWWLTHPSHPIATAIALHFNMRSCDFGSIGECRLDTDHVPKGTRHFRLSVDSGTSSETCTCRIVYDFDGDGKSDRVEVYKTFTTDAQPGWQEYTIDTGLDQAEGEFAQFHHGLVTVEVKHPPGLKVHPAAQLQLSHHEGPNETAPHANATAPDYVSSTNR